MKQIKKTDSILLFDNTNTNSNTDTDTNTDTNTILSIKYFIAFYT